MTIEQEAWFMSYPPPSPPGDESPGSDQPPHAPPGYPPPAPPSYPPPGEYGSSGGSGPPSGWGGEPPPGYAGSPQGNQKALWSLVIGILAVPLGCYACLGWSGIAAIVLGGRAKREIAASGGRQTGAGQAQAGVILGWVGVLLGTVVLVLNVFLFSTGSINWQYDLGTGG